MKRFRLFGTPSIRRRISSAFLIVTALVMTTVIFGYFQLRQVKPTTESIIRNSVDMENLQRLSLATVALDADLEQYIVIGGLENTENVQNDLQEISNAMQLLQESPLSGLESDIQSDLEKLKEYTSLVESGSRRILDELPGTSSAETNRNILRVYNDIETLTKFQETLSARIVDTIQFTAQEQSEIADSVLFQSIILGVIVVVIAVVTSLVTDRRLRAISNLTNTATAISNGDLSRTAPVESDDEIGTLARSFNTMTNQLRDLIGTLEHRVNQRTQELTLAAEVGQSLSVVQDLDTLLSSAVEMIRERFKLYYVQIYLADSTGRALILQAGSGQVGAELLRRGHRLPIGAGSLNGRAAEERRALIVSDTASSKIFKANPLLPETRSEISMPLQYAGRMIGVIDLQGTAPDSLNVEMLPALEALAGQLAIAIQNARLYERTRQAQAEIAAQTQKITHKGWQEFLNAVERSERFGYIYEQGNLRETKESTKLAQGDKNLTVPIAVGKVCIGTIQLERSADQGWSETEEELIHTIADRVAGQLESLRVLAQADSYRVEAEAATRRLTREGWEQFKGNTQQEGVYYNTNEVLPLQGTEIDFEQPAVTRDLTSRDAKIGELRILGTNKLDGEDLELISTVTERLVAHLENLRLTEQTQTALATTSALYEGSERVVNARTMNEVLLALIQSTALAKMDRAHIYFFDQPWENSMPSLMTNVATWANTGQSPESVGNSYALADYPFLYSMSRSEPFIALDLAGDSRVDLNSRKILDEQGLKSLVVFPLVAAGQWVGAIFGEATTKIELLQEEIQQAEALVGQAGTVAQNLRLIEQTRAVALRERNLRQITAVVRNATSPDAILRTAARELGTAIGRKVVIQLGMVESDAAEGLISSGQTPEKIDISPTEHKD